MQDAIGQASEQVCAGDNNTIMQKLRLHCACGIFKALTSVALHMLFTRDV